VTVVIDCKNYCNCSLHPHRHYLPNMILLFLDPVLLFIDPRRRVAAPQSGS
jgi:hypothetical protein